jgi:hypothetical protein
MSKSVPTAEDFNKAYEYAMKKLCTEIPSHYGSRGLTEWNDNEKVCNITKEGCQPGADNPISQNMFTSSGEYRTFRDTDRMFGEFWKKSPPEFLVMKTTKKSPNKKVCARANFLAWQWCMIPETRADGHEPGITNTPRFQYNVRNGKEECYIPKAYCDSKGMSYNADKKDCYVSNKQKIAEFFSGSVLVRSRKAKRAASDKRLKDNIKLIKKDFPHKGINVYTFEWNHIALTTYGLSGEDIGFIADELNPKYVYKDDLGFKHINLDIEDEYMNKISAFLKIKDSIKNIIV